LCGGLALVNEPTTQLFEQGIVATFLFVQVRTTWIRESAIKIKDVYYYVVNNNDVVKGKYNSNKVALGS
jgi:hypothetical protein